MDYPHLYRETDLHIPGLKAAFLRLDNPPPQSLIANVNIIPFIGEQCVVLVLENGSVEIPGGTLEPGETYLQAAQRELLEEAGAALLDFTVIGAWHCHSSQAKPYRPHLPFPEFYRLVGCGAVELISRPTNPPDGEQVARVEVVSIAEAVTRFTAQNRPELADLYQLAAQVCRG